VTNVIQWKASSLHKPKLILSLILGLSLNLLVPASSLIDNDRLKGKLVIAAANRR
jgi:hypothetical protein